MISVGTGSFGGGWGDDYREGMQWHTGGSGISSGLGMGYYWCWRYLPFLDLLQFLVLVPWVRRMDLRRLSEVMLSACEAGMASQGWSNAHWLEYFSEPMETSTPIPSATLAAWASSVGLIDRLDKLARNENHRGYHSANVLLSVMSDSGGELDLSGPDSDILTFLLNIGTLSIGDLGEIYTMGTFMRSRGEVMGFNGVQDTHLDKARELWAY